MGQTESNLRADGSKENRLSLRVGWLVLTILIIVVSTAVAWLQPPYPRPVTAVADRDPLERMLYPIETNPTLRLPVVPADLRAVGFAEDGRSGWTVGRSGAIFATTDGGETWSAQASRVVASLEAIHVTAGGRRGWVVGSAGTVLTTDDGGATWIPQSSGTRAILRGVHFNRAGMLGWAVGHAGTIIATSDGGKTWAPQRSGVSENLFGIRFAADSLRGLAVGFGGLVLRTTDGGRVWTSLSGAHRSLFSVDLSTDGMRGWAAGYDGQIATTRDGGETWSLNSGGGGPDDDINSLQLLGDGQRGWAVGLGGAVLATSDGGETWTRQEASAGSAYLTSVHFNADGLRGWAVGHAGTIIATTNAGKTWITRAIGKTTLLYGIHPLPGGQRVLANDGGGDLLASDNGGKTWHRSSGAPNDFIRAMHFAADGQRGWAVGTGLYATRDGGRSWASQSSGANEFLRAVHFTADGQRGWAVSERGTVTSTMDGGATWSARSVQAGRVFTSVSFDATGRRGVVTGSEGVLLVTRDGGERWQQQSTGLNDLLTAAHMDPGGRFGWAVGYQGAILKTSDGGERWTQQQSGTVADLWSVRFLPGGLVGWVAGGGGTVLETQNGGETWTALDTKVGTTRMELAFDAEGQVGWAVGHAPALAKTVDGGKTWTPMPWPLRYERDPAPWYWVALALAGVAMWMTFRPVVPPRSRGADAIVTTDAPTSDFARDRLEFGPVARGISRFLRNGRTEPPFTLAISGDWGSGKSTLMGLVCTDLQRYGVRPVWFNAWHHQNEEQQQLLAALLSAVRDRGLPSFWSPDGWWFALRLLWIRAKRRYALTFLLFAAVACAMAYLARHGIPRWSDLAAALDQHVPVLSDEIKKVPVLAEITSQIAKALSAAAAVVTAFLGIRRAFKAFGTDPAVLLVASAARFNLRNANAQTNFRASFAAQFDEVTQALPYPMVIVIDDLDRCRAEVVLDVMEAVNFLVSSGRCFVIFGMATHRVEGALALTFEKIAKELVELDPKMPSNASPEMKELAERERRRAYAADYLEKLINLEIAVPNPRKIPPHQLLETADDDERSAAHSLKQLLRLWPVVLVVCAVALGGLGGWNFVWNSAPKKVNVERLPGTGSSELGVAALIDRPLGQRRVEQVPPPTLVAPRYVPSVQPADDRWPSPWTFALAVAAFATLSGGLVIARLRERVRVVDDSNEFINALRMWTPVVRAKRGTPRAIKRFGNRLRYLAMLHQEEALDETGLDLVRKRAQAVLADLFRRLAGRSSRPEASAVASAPVSLDEHRLVALGAICDAYGENWRGNLRPEEKSDVAAAVRIAIESYEAVTGLEWPPSSAELEAFDESLRGVRLAGDADVLRRSRRAFPNDVAWSTAAPAQV